MAWTRDQMVQRAIAQLRGGECVGLGCGLPLRAARWITAAQPVWLLGQNGLLGPGAEPLFLAAVDTFAISHGGHVDLAIVEALQVSERGDLANGCGPGALLEGTDCIMDLVAGARRVVVLMEHLTVDGEQRLVSECDRPLLGGGVVDRVITELGVMDITPHGLQLVELAEGVSLSEISGKTGVALNLVVDEHPRQPVRRR